MLAPAPDFPNSVVRLVPDRFQMFDQRAFKSPTRVICRKTGPPRHIKRVKDFSVNIELDLASRGITNPYRGRFLIARKPGHLVFHEASLSSHAIHDLQIIRTSGNRSQ